MKSSHQTLMLGILMGMIAWLLDAMISWHFYPGNTFLEMLFSYDPGKTLYIRATVVLLFFFFGLVAGQLLSQSEQVEKKLREQARLIGGVREIHEHIVQHTKTIPLIEALLPLISKTFQMDQVCFFALKGEDQGEALLLGDEQEDESQLRKKMQKLWPAFMQGQGIQWIAGGPQGGEFLTPVRLGGRLFGILHGHWEEKRSFEKSEEYRFFLSVCDDLGHALAHLKDVQHLNEYAEKLSRLYENAPIGIFTTTIKGKFLFVNPYLARVFGAAGPEEILNGDCPVSRFYRDPARRKEFIRILQQDRYVSDFEADFVGLDGKVRTLLFAARLSKELEDEDGILDGFAIDITHTKKGEQENRILQQQLADAQHYKSITVLAGGVAHEFNNILQTMMGSAYMAQLKIPEKRGEIWEYLYEIQNSGRRAAKLCDQMLSYAGRKSVSLKPDHPDQCLENVMRILSANAPAGVIIQKKFTVPSVQVKLDVPSLSEILNQLICNAQESLGSKGGVIQLTTETARLNEGDFEKYQIFGKTSSDECWVLRIKDNGCGISEDNLPHIFEPFFTTKFQGRGLGLASVAGLVEKLNGALGVKSRPGEGSEFSLWLPLVDLVIVEAQSGVSSTDLFNGSGKIWVVDDEPLICMTIERALCRLGFGVITASDGDEALAMLRKVKPADIRCLILDVTMPRMGGVELMRKLRPLMPDLPVMIMSGYDEGDSLEMFKGLNVAGFVHKPFRMQELQERIKDVLASPA